MQNKGILQYLKGRTPAEYNPDKFWKENTIESIFKDLQKWDDEDKKRKKENGWKPEYFLSNAEAKKANLMHLQWLCNNYRVIGGSETNRTIRQRQIIINFKNS